MGVAAATGDLLPDEVQRRLVDDQPLSPGLTVCEGLARGEQLVGRGDEYQPHDPRFDICEGCPAVNAHLTPVASHAIHV